MVRRASIRDLKTVLDQLEEERDDAAKALSEAQSRLDEIVERIHAIHISIELIEERLTEQTGDQPAKVIRNAIVEVLRASRAPMTYREIYDELVARGVPVPGKDPLRNVSAHLSNDARFENYPGEGWGLASWGGSTSVAADTESATSGRYEAGSEDEPETGEVEDDNDPFPELTAFLVNSSPDELDDIPF